MTTLGGEARPSVLDRVFSVLESCAASGRPLTLVDLSKRTGLPKTTLHRVCWKLVGLGMLSRSGDGFLVSQKLFALGGMNPALRRLRAVAMPHLHDLASRTESATNLAIMSGHRALIVDEVYGPNADHMPRMIGARLPLHATATGKCLLAGFTDAELDELLAHRLRAYTQDTVVQPTILREQITRARSHGVVYSYGEWAQNAYGVAAPVYQHGAVVAAIAAIATEERAMDQLRPYVARAGVQLSAALCPETELVAV